MIEIVNLRDEPDHLPVLASWHQHVWSYLNPGETLADRISRMQPCLSTTLIPSTFIAKNDRLLGSAAIIEHDMDTRPHLTPWLASVFVTPGHRHKGIGRKLVLHVMAQARINGINKLYLFTADKQYFYMKLGWTIMDIENYHGQEVTVMQAELEITPSGSIYV